MVSVLKYIQLKLDHFLTLNRAIRKLIDPEEVLEMENLSIME